jgi:hypothetical protein
MHLRGLDLVLTLPMTTWSCVNGEYINSLQDLLRGFLVLALADATTSGVRRRFSLPDVGTLPLSHTVKCAICNYPEADNK